MVKLNSDSWKMIVLRFLMSVVVFVVVSFVIRFFANSSRVLFSHYGDVLKSALCASLVLQLWDFDRKAIKAFILFSVLYVAAACIKLPVNMPLNSNEIVDAFSFAILICAAVLLLLRGFHLIKNLYLKRFFLVLFDVVLVAALLLPVACIGYYLLSGSVLTTTIVLTLFQTNPSEAAAYIKDRGVILWCGGLAFAFLLIGVMVYYINQIRLAEKKSRIIVLCVLAVISIVLGGKVGADIVNHVQTITVFTQTRKALKEYKEYGKAKEMRMKNLEQLAGLSVKPGQGGLYVLVIGESETRDHMHAYGYKRENTPWLSAAMQKENTVLFRNAYSNHTHTVPVLTYALSAKNQYNSIPLSKAYSIMEVAKAAGYKTFWISNQVKFGAWDIPTAAIASTSDHEIWLNGNTGKTTETQFYDEEIAKRIDEIKLESGDNIFLVCHLMGCHGSYADRYPAEFEKFKAVDSSEKVSEYDNSVYYNDYVLAKIYEKVSRQKNFKAMVYFSDHGEEPDEDKGHEASKFTWRMARIPFAMFFSESFIAKSNSVYQTLRKNKDRYWTNDLLFNVLINMLGI